MSPFMKPYVSQPRVPAALQVLRDRLAAGLLALLVCCPPVSAEPVGLPSLEEGLREAWISAGQTADH